MLGTDSVELRRALGPTAWVVFEQLLLASTVTPSGSRASVSVRSLAAELGLAKDTVARALSRLRRAGLVRMIQTRTRAGAFAAGSYLLTIPDSITVETAPQTTRSDRRSQAPRSITSQLVLAID